MPQNLFPLDNTKKFTDQKHVGHNRWHPDIPAVVSVKPGDVFRAECREWFDGAIHNDDSADDVRTPLSGGARPQRAVPCRGRRARRSADRRHSRDRRLRSRGRRAVLRDGVGLHRRVRQRERRWLSNGPVPRRLQGDFRLTGDVATSRHIPECSYVGIHHPGLMGTAPSAELLAKWTKRETDLIATDPDRVPPLALPPLPDSAIWHPRGRRVRQGGRRGGPNGSPSREWRKPGHQELHLAGTRVFYPVFVEGAKLSLGDLHFSQGDGEITFCGAIEMGGFVDLHVDLIKGGMQTYGVSENAIFMPGLRDPQYSEWIAFSGISVDLAGTQNLILDSQLSYARAPPRHRLPDEVRLQRYPGVHDPGLCADRGTVLRCGGHP